MKNREAIAEYVKKHYTYNARTGRVQRRKTGRDMMGFSIHTGYLFLTFHIDGVKTHVRYHHVVWLLCCGRWPAQIDHVDGNPCNNRIENLREVTVSENNLNRQWAWRPNAATGLPGVYNHHGMIGVNLRRKKVYFHDKYEAFITTILLGRMYENK